MPDWAAYVRRRLSLPALESEREAEIVEDLARQLDDAYREALEAGATEATARARAEHHVSDWSALAAALSRSPRQRRDPVERWSAARDDRALTRRARFGRAGRLRQDLVCGWRTLRRTPGVTAVALLSLALGIGANTAVWSVIHALLLRDLPVPHPEQLVSLTDPQAAGIKSGLQTGERMLLSYHEFEDLRAAGEAFDGMLAFSASTLPVPVEPADAGGAARVGVRLVSGSYFPVVGVPPLAGRAFGEEVDRGRLGHPVAVLSHRFWDRRLHRDPAVVGRTLRLRRTAFTVVGIMPAGFHGLVVGEVPDVWVPLTMQEAVAPGDDWLTQRPGIASRTMFLHVVARLKAGTTMAQAASVANGLFARGLAADAASVADANRRRDLLDSRLELHRARHGLSWMRGEYGRPLAILMALVGLLLLLTCANVANLLLARAAGRRREMAMRVALGAGRARLVRQLLTESLLLASAGAVLGLAVAYGGARVLLWLASGGPEPVPLDATLDGPVLAFTAVVTLATGVLFGLAPALSATRVDLRAGLHGSAPAQAAPGRWRGWPPTQVLAAGQVAISLVLVVAAGLFVGSLLRLGRVPLGYDGDRIVQFAIQPVADGYAADAMPALFDDLVARIRATPGVAGATYSSNGLFYGEDFGTEMTFPGSVRSPDEDLSSALDLVGPGYFSTLGIPVRLGRDVTAADADGVRGAWLNETAARDFFPGETPIGRRMIAHYSFGDVEYEIRGVVADAREQSLRDAVERRTYLPFFNAGIPLTSGIFQVAAPADPAPLVPPLRRVVAAAAPRLTTPSFYTVAELLGDGLTRDRVTARLSALFGLMALALASIGLYGVLSYGVSRRVGEIGVRLALGARPSGIVHLVVRDALRVVAIGAIVGIGAALAAARLVESMLFGLTARDPLTMTGAVGVLLLVASIAAAIPAWRAARIDPLTALRRD